MMNKIKKSGHHHRSNQDYKNAHKKEHKHDNCQFEQVIDMKNQRFKLKNGNKEIVINYE